jgi:HD-GYP domain-containing protein (c-di-GMP phosphodiesterase class II)
MSVVLELRPQEHSRTHRRPRSSPRPAPASPVSRAPAEPPASRLLRYLPVATFATGVVIVAPAAVIAAFIPRGGILLTLATAALAVAISLGLAVAGAALWKRQVGSRDVVFADLMLWCWARRYINERRLSQARELFESARRAGPRVNIEMLLGLSRLLEARDAFVHGHSQRVARHATRVARAMGLSEQEVAKISTAAEVHDVGKLYTPREILNNPRQLTAAEFEIVKQHAPCGAEMVSVVGDPEITAMVRHHHERIDGGGYPDGLAGSAIPLGARIIAVADTFDAITSERAYRPLRSQKLALDILAAEAGRQLDAEAVASFKQGYSARRSVAWYAFAATAVQRAVAALQSLLSHLGVGAASVATLAPALGAAGVLAVSPGLFRVSHTAQPPGGSLALLQQLLPSGGGVPSEADGPAGSLGGAPSERGGIRPPTHGRLTPAIGVSPISVGAPSNATGAPGSPGSPGANQNGPSGGSTSPSPAAPAPSAGGPVAAPPSTPPVTTPRVTTPTIGAPPGSTPSATTPSVTTPAVTVPSVTVPSVTVPSVTVPSVTVPSVTVPASP